MSIMKDMVFGKYRTKEKITIQELYELIKDEEFPIGKPVVGRKSIGLEQIFFPQVGHLQVAVRINGKSISAAVIPASIKNELAMNMAGLQHRNYNLNIAAQEILEIIGKSLEKHQIRDL